MIHLPFQVRQAEAQRREEHLNSFEVITANQQWVTQRGILVPLRKKHPFERIDVTNENPLLESFQVGAVILNCSTNALLETVDRTILEESLEPV